MADFDFRLERWYPAPAAAVYAHFTEPALMARWFCPNPALDVSCHLDVRVGGEWSCTMGRFAVGGHYTVVDPPTALAFTWSWTHSPAQLTTVRVTFAPERDGTKLLLDHREEAPDVGSDGHRGGWDITLDRLAATLHLDR